MAAYYYPAPGLAGFGGLSSDVLCPRGQVEDYDPATGKYLGTCVDETTAYDRGPIFQPPSPTPRPGPYNAGNRDTVNIKAGSSNTNTDTYILVGAAAILIFFMMKHR